MTIYLGADHSGFALKEKVFAYLVKKKHVVENIGGIELDPSDDFPEFAQVAALKIIGDISKDPRAIMVCGEGQGMSMAANRFRGIRSSVVWDEQEARLVRRDYDSNVLCLPVRMVESNDELWQDIISTWLNTSFTGADRYKRRNARLDEIL